VDLIVDDTPETVLVSCHNPIRRQIACMALNTLIPDGRIHRGRIEEGLRRAEPEREADVGEGGLGYRIRGQQLRRVPYMLVVGDREAADGAVGVRSRAAGDLGARPTEQFVADALAEIASKAVS